MLTLSLSAVGATISTQSLLGDVSYGFINYVDTSSPGYSNYATPNSTIIPGSFTTDYFGRANNNSGWIATDWVGTSGINGATPTLTPAARAALAAFDWPGNVRELENLVERMVILSEDGWIRVENLPSNIRSFISEKRIPKPSLSESGADGLPRSADRG